MSPIGDYLSTTFTRLADMTKNRHGTLYIPHNNYYAYKENEFHRQNGTVTCIALFNGTDKPVICQGSKTTTTFFRVGREVDDKLSIEPFAVSDGTNARRQGWANIIPIESPAVWIDPQPLTFT